MKASSLAKIEKRVSYLFFPLIVWAIFAVITLTGTPFQEAKMFFTFPQKIVSLAFTTVFLLHSFFTIKKIIEDYVPQPWRSRIIQTIQIKFIALVFITMIALAYI